MNKKPLTTEQQHEIYEYVQEKNRSELISLISHWDYLAFYKLGRETAIKNKNKFIDMYIEEFGKDDNYIWLMKLKEIKYD